MNRILFEPSEIDGGIARFGGARAEHVMTVLHGEVGQRLKTGVVNGKIGSAEIVEISDLGGGSWSIAARVCHDREAIAPWVDLILAPPRPRILKRLLPQIAALGAGRIALVGASKVEKDFWGATLLKSEVYRPLLIDGLMQSGTSALPEITVARNFRRWLESDFERQFPSPRRIVAHPYAPSAHPDHSSTLQLNSSTSTSPLTLAIGPEGGWTDDEVALLEAHGFSRYSLGPRILRTDTATVALLARLMAAEG